MFTDYAQGGKNYMQRGGGGGGGGLQGEHMYNAVQTCIVISKRLAGWLTMARFCVCKIMKNVSELLWLLPRDEPNLPHSMVMHLDVPSVYIMQV